jgi:ATP-dependent Clp protease ATP-binding subunit ClpA
LGFQCPRHRRSAPTNAAASAQAAVASKTSRTGFRRNISMAIAAKEAQSLGAAQLGSEHLLLGILREGDSIPARLLQMVGVTCPRMREAILKEPSEPLFEGGLGI